MFIEQYIRSNKGVKTTNRIDLSVNVKRYNYNI